MVKLARNIWPHYRGPENKGGRTGKDIVIKNKPTTTKHRINCARQVEEAARTSFCIEKDFVNRRAMRFMFSDL